MSGVSGNIYTLQVGRQTAKGTAQTTPAYALKVTGGDISPQRETIQLAETDSSRQEGATVVVGSRVEGTPEFYIRPSDFGLFAYAALGGLSTGGTAPNYIHTVTPANAGPYLTIYKTVGGLIVDRYRDCRVTSMRIRGQAGQPLSCAVTILGLTSLFNQSDPAVAVVTESPLVYSQLVVTKGGGVPGTVEQFEIVIENGGAPLVGDGSLSPYDYVWGELQVSGTMTLLFESDDDYNRFHTGTAGGTAPTTTLYTEALNLKASVDANTYLEAQVTQVAYTEYPVNGDPGGAPIRVAAGWRAQPQASIANLFRILLANQVSAY